MKFLKITIYTDGDLEIPNLPNTYYWNENMYVIKPISDSFDAIACINKLVEKLKGTKLSYISGFLEDINPRKIDKYIKKNWKCGASSGNYSIDIGFYDIDIKDDDEVKIMFENIKKYLQ